MKEWKTIPNYASYEASSDGEIKTFNWKNFGLEKIMSPAMDGGGYLRTMLKRDDGKIHTIKVHRIIAQAFIPNPCNKPCVNHINGIRSDNRVVNLEWCTESENSLHSYKIGLSSNKGEKNPASTITEEQAKEILANYKFGKRTKEKEHLTKKQLAEKYNTSFHVIKSLIQRKTWKHLS